MDFLESDIGKFDLIFVDPPTFSNRKAAEDVFDVQRDHAELLRRASRSLKEGGRIVFSNNYRQFQLDPDLCDLFHVEEISDSTIPPDFQRNRRIHRCWILRSLQAGSA